MGIKRREILKVGTLSAGLMAVSEESIGHNVNDHYDTDVLIIGAGNAGIPAAIEASDLGRLLL